MLRKFTLYRLEQRRRSTLMPRGILIGVPRMSGLLQWRSKFGEIVVF